MSNPAAPTPKIMMSQKEILCYILGVLQNSGQGVVQWGGDGISRISYQTPTVERIVNMIKDALKEV